MKVLQEMLHRASKQQQQIKHIYAQGNEPPSSSQAKMSEQGDRGSNDENKPGNPQVDNGGEKKEGFRTLTTRWGKKIISSTTSVANAVIEEKLVESVGMIRDLLVDVTQLREVWAQAVNEKENLEFNNNTLVSPWFLLCFEESVCPSTFLHKGRLILELLTSPNSNLLSLSRRTWKMTS